MKTFKEIKKEKGDSNGKQLGWKVSTYKFTHKKKRLNKKVGK